MTPAEQTLLLTSPVRDLGKLFPQHPVIELKRARLKLQKARAAKTYRQKYYGTKAIIGQCPAYQRAIEDARHGSAMLLAAIQRAGVRP